MLRKSFISLIICLFVASAIVVTGCGKKEEKLDLPESEMRQLKAVGSKATQEITEDAKPSEMEGSTKFYVYAEKGYFKNHFIPSGWMGDYGDIKFIDGWRENPQARRSCIKIIYTAQKKQGAGWAGIYWQEPANNWGTRPGGFDLTGAEKLSFYAKGEKGGEIIAELKMGGIMGEYSDSTSVSIGPIVLTPEWTQYTIDLKGEDLSNVIGGFAFVLSSMENPDGATFYLDNIAYE